MAKSKAKEKLNITNITATNITGMTGAYRYDDKDCKTVAFMIPRNKLKSIKFTSSGLTCNSIYFLFGYEQDDTGRETEMVYVGQAVKGDDGKGAIRRLKQHNSAVKETYYDYWDTAIIVTNEIDKWDHADLDALEHAFCNIIDEDILWNKKNPTSGDADYTKYETKIRDIKRLITAIGYTLFEDDTKDTQIQIKQVIDTEGLDEKVVEDLQMGLSKIPEIVTPQKVVKQMCDIIPEELWNDKTVFLDPACKGGEYLREIYDRLMETQILKDKHPNVIERSNHILGEQLYGIALSQVSLDRTTKKLMGYGNNIKVIPEYINKLKGIGLGSLTDSKVRTIQDILNEEFGKEMKIDVVIGNPPYQENTGEGSRAVPIYQLFVNAAFEMSNIVCMITPARWFSASDNKSKQMRKNILCNQTNNISYYNKSDTLFGGITINGGVSYFCTNKKYEGNTVININGDIDSVEQMTSTEIFIPNKYYRGLMRKMTNKKRFLDNTIFSQNAFGLDTNFFGIQGDIVVRTSSGYNDYIEKKDIEKGIEYIEKFKVITGSMNTTSIINKPEILNPKIVCTRTYTVLGIYDTLQNALIVQKYFMSKFVRALIDMTLNNQMVSRDNYKFVPFQDFTENSDIDWSKSISDIDQQLYRKYNLTQEEIDYIERTIKPMD